MYVNFEIAAVFPSPYSHMKKGGNFKTNFLLDSVESFLKYLSSSPSNFSCNRAFQSIVYNSDQKMVLRAIYFIRAYSAITYYFKTRSQRHLLAASVKKLIERPVNEITINYFKQLDKFLTDFQIQRVTLIISRGKMIKIWTPHHGQNVTKNLITQDYSLRQFKALKMR